MSSPTTHSRSLSAHGCANYRGDNSSDVSENSPMAFFEAFPAPSMSFIPVHTLERALECSSVGVRINRPVSSPSRAIATTEIVGKVETEKTPSRRRPQTSTGCGKHTRSNENSRKLTTSKVQQQRDGGIQLRQRRLCEFFVSSPSRHHNILSVLTVWRMMKPLSHLSLMFFISTP